MHLWGREAGVETRTDGRTHETVKGQEEMAAGLPGGCLLERDPDLLVSRAGCGRVVAAVSALGATKEAILEAAASRGKGAPAGERWGPCFSVRYGPS